MEAEAGNIRAAQNVYQRSIRDSIGSTKPESINYGSKPSVDGNGTVAPTDSSSEDVLKTSNSEVEFSRWNSKKAFGESAVWMKDGSIEGKVPSSAMKKGSKKSKK